MTEVANRFIIPGWLLLSDNPKEKSKKSWLADIVRTRLSYYLKTGLHWPDLMIDTNHAAKLFLEIRESLASFWVPMSEC